MKMVSHSVSQSNLTLAIDAQISVLGVHTGSLRARVVAEENFKERCRAVEKVCLWMRQVGKNREIQDSLAVSGL